jgi:hypothetical protein
MQCSTFKLLWKPVIGPTGENFFPNIWRFTSSCTELFVLKTDICIQSVTNSKRNSVKQHHAPAQTVLTCQQQHENTQVTTEYKTM